MQPRMCHIDEFTLMLFNIYVNEYAVELAFMRFRRFK